MVALAWAMSVAASPGAAPKGGGAADAASAEWVSRLGPHVIGEGRPGHDEEKYLVDAATRDEAEMKRRLRIAAEASRALADYRRAELGEGATKELRRMAADLEEGLRRFGESCVESANEDLAEAERRIGGLEAFVRAQDDLSEKWEVGLYPDRLELEQARDVLARATRLLKRGDPRQAALAERLEALNRADARLRAARAGETRMRPDAYAGADAAELKAFAGQVVARAAPGVALLRTVLVSPDWVEESVVEWADEPSAELRHRTTRCVMAEVAGRLGANTKLYTVALDQDLLAGGGWGATGGRVLFVDPMWEENVKGEE